LLARRRFSGYREAAVRTITGRVGDKTRDVQDRGTQF
jgi:hypothetical protein